jgi:hypothetical protein
MNNGGMWRGILIAIVLVSAAAMIGIGSYNAGVAQGIVDSGKIAALPAGSVPYAYGWHRPWGPGFFPLFPLISLFLFFAVVRGLWWRGPRRGGWGYHHCDGVPPAFDEWHRRAHERQHTAGPGTGGMA